MDALSPTSESSATSEILQDARLLLLGKFVGMPRRETTGILREHGAVIVDKDDSEITLVVVGDDVPDWRPLVLQQDSTDVDALALAEAIEAGRIELVRESELWRRLGLVEQEHDVRRLYTPAMLADLLEIPVAAVRRWHRQGVLIACHSVRRLPYFDFAEVAISRHLADLLHAGCSLRVIDRKLQELARFMPEVERPLGDQGILVEGRQLFIRKGDDLTEPGGQLQLDFDRLDEYNDSQNDACQSIPLVQSTAAAAGASQEVPSQISTLDGLLQEAMHWEDQGELDRASETYRAMLVAAGPSAETNFSLADVLYRQGDPTAARERYYMAIELDEEYVEARANLGCVLAETGELEMAVAAFQGALAYHADYADVHYHLAGALDRLQRHDEAELHWQAFLAQAPESPWAETARTRLADVATGCQLSTIGQREPEADDLSSKKSTADSQ